AEPVDQAVRHQAARHRAAQPEPVRNATAAPATKPVTEPVGSVASAEAVDRIAGEARPLVASLPGLPPLLSVLPELP
ncbi:hypothetical protein, partial [Streptomyces parvus]